VTRSRKVVSGNPTGRPRGLVSKIKEAVGEDGVKLVSAVVGVLDDPGATNRDRLAAAEWLSDRAFGKPALSISGHGPQQIAVLGMLASAREQTSGHQELEEGRPE